MKSWSIAVFLILFPLYLPGAGKAEKIGLELQRSGKNLPAFDVFIDHFGAVRSIRVLHGGKTQGRFSMKALKKYQSIGMVDLRGVAEVDMTGVADLPMLHSLHTGRAKLVNYETAASKSLFYLDISESDITDVKWLNMMPALRTLLLPESVRDISPLKGRSFRALSAPGIDELPQVCRSLGIRTTVGQRVFRRRSGRGAFPPTFLTYDRQKKLTALQFASRSILNDAAADFESVMFPAESLRKWPAMPQRYPGLWKDDGSQKRGELQLKFFEKDRKTLKKLDLRGVRRIAVSGVEFPVLEELYLSGSVRNLESLKAPRLKVLVLDNVEGAGSDSGYRRFSGDRSRRSGAAMIKLPAGLKLKNLEISLRRDELDFDSLKNIRFERLVCRRFSGDSLEFLKGQPLKSLQLRAPQVRDAAVLGTLPLKELSLQLHPGADWSFLKKLALSSFSLRGNADNFALALLKDQPIGTLRLFRCVKYGDNWNVIRTLPLKELVIREGFIGDGVFLRNFKDLERLALENCGSRCQGKSDTAVARDLMSSIAVLKKLNALRIGMIYYYGKEKELLNPLFYWERLQDGHIYALSICTDRVDFLKKFTKLQKIKIDDISKDGITPEQVQCGGGVLKILALANGRQRLDRPVPERRTMFRRPLRPEAVNIPGVAEKVYLDGPTGFDLREQLF